MGGGQRRRAAGGIKAAEAPRAVPDRVVAVEMATDEHAQARTRAPAGLLGELQSKVGGGHDVVAADDAFFLDTEDLVQIDSAEGHERRGGIGGGAAKLAVEGGEEPLPQIAIGRGERADAGQAVFIDEAILERAIGALAAPPSLRRKAEDVFDA